MTTFSDEQIRERAHKIWMEEGCPHGRDVEHWEAAIRELDRDEGRVSNTDLDEALAESFPASDPIAFTPIAGVGGPEEDEEDEKKVVEARFAGTR